MSTKYEPTIDDLYKVEGKAELVNGEILHLALDAPFFHFALLEIRMSLRAYEIDIESGYAVGGTVAFVVDLPHRKSFCPDAAFFVGTYPGMKFFEGAPMFAVEVRNEDEYGPNAEHDRAAKRADYFAAGTQVVWDVDLLTEDVIRVYRATDTENPTIYRRGEIAEAEPAVPGWTFAVDDLFRKKRRQ